MLNHLTPASATQDWQAQLSDMITTPSELWATLGLPIEALNAAQQACGQFKLKIPRAYLPNFEYGNPKDPLLLQFLPQAAELLETPGYTLDPLQEAAANPIPGLLHKYHGRVLVTLSSACAVHCRYCFRRHFPYAENNPGTKGWQHIYAYLKSDESIEEVILSGGDPLSVSDHLLAKFLSGLNDIKHLQRLRIHTRLPLIIPARISQPFLQVMQNCDLEKIMVMHANHPREITPAVKLAMQQLKSENMVLLNQSVLLKNINDSAETLADLSRRLFDAGILPYYLHLLDKVQNAAHYDMDRKDALQLYNSLQKKLPGYLIPRLAVEEAGEKHKTLVTNYNA